MDLSYNISLILANGDQENKKIYFVIPVPQYCGRNPVLDGRYLDSRFRGNDSYFYIFLLYCFFALFLCFNALMF